MAAGAAVAVEELEKLNPNLWAYFASVSFPGDQVSYLVNKRVVVDGSGGGGRGGRLLERKGQIPPLIFSPLLHPPPPSPTLN